MRAPAGLLLTLAIALPAAGCIDLEQDFTLNPDGSGKVVVRWVASPFIEIGGEKSPDARAKSLLKDEIAKSEGVDAWKDVSCEVRKGGKFEFKGTAYFKDFSQLKLHNNGFKMMAVRASKDAAGNFVVESEPAEKGEPPGAMSDEKAKKELEEARTNHGEMKKVLQIMMSDLKVSTRIRLPGRVAHATNFKKDGETAVRISLAGAAFTKALDELMQDDAWMLRAVRAGGLQEPAALDEAFNEKVFGEKAPVRAVTTGELKPAFEYEKEAAPARKAWEETAAALGAAAGPPAKGEGFTSLKAAGVAYVYEDSHKSQGVKLSLAGEFAGSVLNVTEGRLTSATTDTGANVLPREFDRSVRFPKLGEDRKSVSFDVTLQLPPADAKGYKEISGTLTYATGGKTKDVDLGITELKAGAQGKNASITEIEDSKWEEGRQSISIHLDMSNMLIESIVILDESGKTLPTKASGYSASSNQVTRTLSIRGKFPAKGKIIAKVYDDLKTYEIPFKLENLDLLGRPLK